MSRYPSAYGHTPTYKSVGGLSSYPSALSSSSTTSSSVREMDREMGAMKREMDRDFGVMTVRLFTLQVLTDLTTPDRDQSRP